MKRRTIIWFAAVMAVFGLLASSCGDDDDADDGAAAVTEAAPAAEDEAPTAAEEEEAPMAEEEEAPMAEEEEAPMAEEEAPVPEADPLDINGDGEVTIGVATAGPRDDGAYYQELVNLAIEFSEAHGWADPVIIDNVEPAVAFNELENLVAQGVDIVAVGSGELSDAVPDMIEQYPDLIWYCNCGAGYPQTPGLITSRDDGAQIEYAAGFATGLLLKERGGDSVYMIGCCDLGFEVETELAFRLGLRDVDPSYTLTYTPTGNFPFDFDNVAGATEAFNVALDAGMDAVYPYLGGAHEPLVQLANANDVIVMSAGPSNVCERTDLHWDMAVLFSAGDFALAIFSGIVDGTIDEGTVKFFEVGVDPEVGSKICGPTAEQEEALTQAQIAVAEGYCAEEFGLIQAIAYGGVEADAPESCA
jgi:basic membrane protein A